MLSLVRAILALLLALQPVNFAHAQSIGLSDIEEAKSDLLFLDRQLSKLEGQMFFAERTTILFGLSAKSTKSPTLLQLRINGQPVADRALTKLDLLSLQKGAMLPLFDNNLPKGVHEIQLSYQLSDGSTEQQVWRVNKTIDKQLVGLKLLDNPPPRSPPVRLTLWIGDDE